jgi:ABC-2 type transport system permease protein
MHALTGTGRLIRLALRRDRIKITIILLVLAGVFMSSAQAAIDFYGKSDAARVQYAAANAPSVVARVFNGPINGPDIGAIAMNETYIFTALALAFVSTMTVIRHTRQNEEFGRSELIESATVSRHASLAAAMTAATLYSLLFGALAYVSLLAVKLPADGALAASGALAATGITFAGLAAVCAQLADSGRGANSFSALVIGTSFLLRAIGDGLGTLTQQGLAVKSAWPSWLSPFGWGQQLFPFTEQNWWVLGLYTALFAGSLGVAIIFMARRDIGMGMIATRPGRAQALPNLLSPFGLAKRLQRGALRGWAAVVVVLAASYGLVIKEFGDFLSDNEQFQQAFGLQDGADISKVFLGMLISFMSITIAAYAVQSLLRLRSEESGGQLESILAGSVSRWRWQLSHIGFIGLGVTLLSGLSGLTMGATYIASTGESWGRLGPVVVASLVGTLPIFALMGFVVLAIALLPKLAIALAWGSFAGCLLIVQFGELLKLPQWVISLSPFGHLAAMPAYAFKLAPVLWLAAIAASLLLGALLYFNRRDVLTS